MSELKLTESKQENTEQKEFVGKTLQEVQLKLGMLGVMFDNIEYGDAAEKIEGDWSCWLAAGLLCAEMHAALIEAGDVFSALTL